MIVKKLLGIFLSISCLFVLDLKSAVFYVSSTATNGGNGQTWVTAFPKVQNAIESAAAHDEIWVASGVYFENLNLREGVSLFGGFAGTETNRSQRNWNIHSTIIDGRNIGRVVTLASAATIPTRLDGFVIRNGRAGFGAGIYVAGGAFISANNLFVHNTADGVFGGGGVFVDETVQFPAQSPITFFTNMANRLLQLHSPDLSTSRIQLFPTNDYSPEVHRRLQVAANLYDATTNRGTTYPYFPSVFRPIFTNDNGAIFISGYIEAVDDSFIANPWLSLKKERDRAALFSPVIQSNANIFGQPIVIGAKKGFPNFNEFSMETILQVSRYLQFRKLTTNSPPYQTNQMYMVGFSNIFGIESWNSYVKTFPRPLELRVSHTLSASITDETGAIIWPTNGLPFATNFSPSIVVSNWAGEISSSGIPTSFVLPYFTNITMLPFSQYMNAAPHFRSNSSSVFETNAGFPVPTWVLNFTNRIEYFAIDSGRVVDFVTLDEMETRIDLSHQMLLFPYDFQGIWNTNRLGNSTDVAVPTHGVRSQIDFSMGMPFPNDALWRAYGNTLTPNQRDYAIAMFTSYMGHTPWIPGYQNIPMPPYLETQTPLNPVLKLHHRVALQANDPLVHFQISDLVRRPISYPFQWIIPPSTPFAPSNLRRINEACRPYQQRFGPSKYRLPYSNSSNPYFQDASIEWSEDWRFPSTNLFNLHWLDQVHRGTPWQTLYTGPTPLAPQFWESWSGNAEAYPSNDWEIAEMFLKDRESFGAPLSSTAPVFVNNTIAANSALDGGAVSVAASAILLNNIVAQNTSGLFRLLVTNDVIIQTNSVSQNAQYDFANLSSVGNTSDDPQFVAAGSSNFHLLATSPMIDTGSDAAFASGWLLNEPARIRGNGVDLGAFELSQEEPPVFTPPLISLALNEITFSVTGFSGETFILEISDDLMEWIPVSTNVTANGFFTITDAFDGMSNRFYRAVRHP